MGGFKNWSKSLFPIFGRSKFVLNLESITLGRNLEEGSGPCSNFFDEF
jgi:hypothetical protein